MNPYAPRSAELQPESPGGEISPQLVFQLQKVGFWAAFLSGVYFVGIALLVFVYRKALYVPSHTPIAQRQLQNLSLGSQLFLALLCVACMVDLARQVRRLRQNPTAAQLIKVAKAQQFLWMVMAISSVIMILGQIAQMHLNFPARG